MLLKNTSRPNRSRSLPFAWSALVFFFAALAWDIQPGFAQETASSLKIADVLFEDFDGSLRSQFAMAAGGEVALAFRVEGFYRQPGKDASGLPEYRVSLEYEVELRDPDEVLVEPLETGTIESVLGPRDDRWTPKIRWSASVPAYAPGGDYQIRLRVRDRLDEQQAEARISFRVQGESFRPTQTLEIQQVEYARAETGPWFRQRYFSANDPIYVRYKIVGFDLSPEKEIWLEQDWAILDENQQVIVSHENAAVERQKSFYPPRYVATRFQLSLTDPKPGAYTLRITIRDRIGQQSISADSSFFLRP